MRVCPGHAAPGPPQGASLGPYRTSHVHPVGYVTLIATHCRPQRAPAAADSLSRDARAPCRSDTLASTAHPLCHLQRGGVMWRAGPVQYSGPEFFPWFPNSKVVVHDLDFTFGVTPRSLFTSCREWALRDVLTLSMVSHCTTRSGSLVLGSLG